jgi:hypothetical protein
VLFDQVIPLLLKIVLILCHYRKLGSVMDPVTKEEEPIEFVTLIDNRPGEAQRGGGGLERVGSSIYDD